MMKKQASKKFNGLAILVAMFRAFDPVTRLQFYKKLEVASPLFLKLVQSHEFLLDDLLRLDEVSIQRLLYVIKEDDLIRVWSIASLELKTYMLSNMSERRKENFIVLIAESKKYFGKEVYLAQNRIVNTVLQLMQQGKLAVHSKYSKKK